MSRMLVGWMKRVIKTSQPGPSGRVDERGATNMSAATLTPVIERALVAANKRRYARYASGLAHRVAAKPDATSVVDVVSRYLRDMGIRASAQTPAVRGVIDAINAHLNPGDAAGDYAVSASVVNSPVLVGNDVACDVITAFLLDGGKHLEREDVDGFEPEEIDALLQIAGLKAAPDLDAMATDLLNAALRDRELRVRIARFAVEHGFQA